MTCDTSVTLAEFLDAVAARKPTPGGGAVAAMAGALAAAMGEMVVNYSLGKRGLEAYEPQLRPALAELHRARGVLLQLMAEDQEAYAALAAAKKLTADSPARAVQFPRALEASIRGPQAMAATALAVLELCDRLVPMVNHYLLSDLAVAADLAMATTRCATYNVRVNLPDLTNPAERQAAESSIAQTLSRATRLIQQTAPRIWHRIEQEG